MANVEGDAPSMVRYVMNSSLFEQELCAGLADGDHLPPPDYKEWRMFMDVNAAAAHHPIPPPPTGWH